MSIGLEVFGVELLNSNDYKSSKRHQLSVNSSRVSILIFQQLNQLSDLPQLFSHKSHICGIADCSNAQGENARYPNRYPDQVAFKPTCSPFTSSSSKFQKPICRSIWQT